MADARDALEAIGQLPDGEVDLADAALQLARVDEPRADWHAARDVLSEIARDASVLDGGNAAERAGALAGLVHARYGFAGDGETYDDPANANLIRVIERRRGLPVALGIIWLHAARAVGWSAHGVDFPGHFLIAIEAADRKRPASAKVVLDVFAGGRPCDSRDLRALIKRVEGPQAELQPGVLRPMGTRDVLLRLQNNVRGRRIAAGDLHGGLAAIEDMLRIAPEHATLWREAAALNARLDQVGAALQGVGALFGPRARRGGCGAGANWRSRGYGRG